MIWLPMDTAPRDGTDILLCTTQGIVSAWFDPPVIVHDYFDGDDTEGCQWVCYDDEFTIQVEWWGGDKFCDGSSGILGWMPIPLPPEPILLDDPIP